MGRSTEIPWTYRHRSGTASGWVLVAMLAAARLASAGVPEPKDYFSGDIHSPTPDTLRGGTVIHIDQLPALLKRGAIIIDASDLPHRPDALPKDSVWIPVP